VGGADESGEGEDEEDGFAKHDERGGFGWDDKDGWS